MLVYVVHRGLLGNRGNIGFLPELGSRASEYEQLRISLATWASKSAFSFKSHAGMPSGPVASAGLRRVSFFRTLNSVTGVARHLVPPDVVEKRSSQGPGTRC